MSRMSERDVIGPLAVKLAALRNAGARAEARGVVMASRELMSAQRSAQGLSRSGALLRLTLLLARAQNEQGEAVATGVLRAVEAYAFTPREFGESTAVLERPCHEQETN